jgi:hypothetical protein
VKVELVSLTASGAEMPTVYKASTSYSLESTGESGVLEERASRVEHLFPALSRSGVTPAISVF